MNGLIQDARLITCIVPKGRARLVQEALSVEEDIHGGMFHGGRGVGRFSVLGAAGGQPEKEVLEVCVSADRANEIFEKLYFAGQMNEPHGGIIFMTRLRVGMSMAMPEIEAQIENT